MGVKGVTSMPLSYRMSPSPHCDHLLVFFLFVSGHFWSRFGLLWSLFGSLFGHFRSLFDHFSVTFWSLFRYLLKYFIRNP